ncbi:MAG TPA: UvrD-helicase domain-containing protein [Verrucomicrobiae bacterium]|nr:UvrD-helicase domain-containing protein [Verrucomicrobiae bacterium]
MENLTPSQQAAIAARGNVLVMAGAGTGKTRTLIARCLDVLENERVALDDILIVTFTEAAAAEMRERLRLALEKKSGEQSDDAHWNEQLALFDIAHIGTLHSFCLRLVREHFHELGLDPQLSILDEGQSRLLADETLEVIFNSHYEHDDGFSHAVQELIKIYGTGSDEKIRALVLRLHHYAQTRPDADGWLGRQLDHFSSRAPVQWREWFAEAVENWRNESPALLENLRAVNPKAAECLDILKTGESLQCLQKILAADADWPRGTKRFREALEAFFEDAKFLNSLLPANGRDPITEDWDWIRAHMKTLLQLAREFSENFSARKRDDGVLDFHDLEQFALKLLWDFHGEMPTGTAKRWREKLRFVFVDEYQDINAAQDKIIAALSGDGEAANRFLVGDIKQSIYRFRLADPAIFRDYAKSWRGKNGQSISLAENFRSRESLLDFVNSLFTPLMRDEVGGVQYDEDAKLRFGGNLNPDSTTARPGQIKDGPRTELLLRLKTSGDENREGEEAGNELAKLEESEKEARMLALRLLELKNSGHEIWDEEEKIFRAAEWRDFAVLLRSPSGKAEIYAKQFALAGVPLVVERGGFFDSREISDLLSLLQLLDNPLQDVPLIAVLRSPFAGLSLDELAEIRSRHKGKFWFALNSIQNQNPGIETGIRAKVERFLERFSRWRKFAQQSSLSQCLEEILAATHYDDWLKAQPRGAQRHANVQRFLHLAEQFDQFQRQGLFRFLHFIKAQREVEAEPEIAPAASENAVRLMSIHQSKGLEFPVVALADLGKVFNERDLHGEIILDERFGLCPRVKPPNVGGRFPSLSYWLAKKNQRRELRGEELRLLYVALTRARDTLILSGGISKKNWEMFAENESATSTEDILSARSYLDWIAIWFRGQHPKIQNEGELQHLRWRILADADLSLPENEKSETEIQLPELSENELRRLGEITAWKYPFKTATERAAKTSVTALRRTAEESDDEAEQKFADSEFRRPKKRFAGTPAGGRLSATETGLAHHKFLQHFNLSGATDARSFAAEAARLQEENYLSADEAAALNLENLATFWNSDPGKQIRRQKESVRRELPFTAKFSPSELAGILGTPAPDNWDNEFVVVQGVADLAVFLPQEIWLVDFKTDDVAERDLPEKINFYSPQLKLYAQALEKIYARPVKNCWLYFLSAQRLARVS